MSQDKLDQPVTAEDKELLLAALRQWGALDANYAYKAGVLSSDRRGYERDPGGGLNAEAVPSEPLPFAEILRSRVWYRLALGQIYDLQSTIFQPVGGMDMIARAFVRQIGGLIRYNAKVTAIKQDDNHVTNRANVRLLAQAMSDHSSSVSGLPRSCKSAAHMGSQMLVPQHRDVQRLSIEGPHLIENQRRDVTYAPGLVVVDRRGNDFQYQLARQWGPKNSGNLTNVGSDPFFRTLIEKYSGWR